MAFDPARQIELFHAAINTLDFPAIEAYFAEDATYVSNGVGDLTGRAEIMTAFRRYFDDYPDQTAENSLVETLTAQSGRSVWSVRATHSKTGKALIREGEETITFNAEGRVTRVEVTDYRDF
ncbi:nuclear transport factor 2 family protein [Rhizobium laguerreae]|uniref:Nuclear transport factor 2 family protein n=1 Tax=Rhizobium laguerreae TaxID=1076926 RepID=A0AB35FQY9_9HYPH|nr:nuclear transport factor 2 family protein [Rhizobium laguerreae]MBY3068151.1 nuclear transport factor 2 family protein [Rhizobium laguerreae]MBY3077897.1 nuclear transport factor 2 family protein [Rhizobium laguerreae]MBY3110554.1 nuclear transport factor 2 family protein [Rhizobium laguerreae]MBY3242011.1 nuclear transport factor 2 family protein [Rhizobium laguerreae]MBY3301926.1 nuclear transport factor 2 family protein [Rhizobium laguerreae]